MESNMLFAVISIVITSIVFIMIKVVEFTKFRTLLGSGKATGVIFIIITIAEVMYLSATLKILSPAIEVVTSLSAILLFFTFVYLNKLQNAISGMSIALGRRINVGSEIEFDNKLGTIIQIGLTKTIVELDDSRLMLIPNKKFDEEVSVISNSKIEKIETSMN
ncbi:MAG: mechanosensitive ion channel [Nitrosopumilus sp.]|nr:mechanosensitive ion channel [Nitrosopumilus sp.]